MADDKIESEAKSEIAKVKPRDEEGHFVRTEKPKDPKAKQSPIGKFFSEHTHYSKNKDDIIDIHVGNPLRRIADLLEDIKKQKAFSFTLKGSLGIMGVFLSLGILGVLGGGQILCDKGNQSQIGVIKTLQVVDADGPTIPVLSQFLEYFAPKQMHRRTVLIKSDDTVIRLPYSRNVDFATFSNPVYPEQSRRVIITGNYDSCSQTLKVTDPTDIEIYTGSQR